MKIKVKCSQCSTVLVSSNKENFQEASKSVVEVMKIHLKARHQHLLIDYEEKLKEVITSVNILPAYMLCSAFVDLESEETDKQFKEAYEEMDSMLDPLFELLEEEEEEEIESEEKKEQEDNSKLFEETVITSE